MKIKVWLGVLVSLALLVYLFSKIDIGRLWSVIKTVDPYYLAAVSALSLFFFWIRALRWRYLMEPVKKAIPVGKLFSATMIGFMANNILPARLGEFVRAYVLGHSQDVSKSSVFATIVVERLFDSMSVLLLLIYTVAFLPPNIATGAAAANIRRAGEVSLVLYVAAIALLVYFLYHPRTLVTWVRTLIRPISPGMSEKAAYMAESFMAGLSVVKSPRLLALILFYTALHWGGLWTPIYLLFKAFGLHYGVYESIFMLVVMCLSVAVPSTPGYIGTFHAAATGGLMLLGMKAEPALGFAILAHAMNYVPVTLLGFYFLYKENLSLKGLKKVEQT
jgi:uncharacterized protein (TIRG00374 family)